ncbi:murein hydrolase activator EnvC family protein [Glaciecola sp. 1036]|uniref:murein hydrolase activator EnvC family protein n=1 Tax=Alteromonadaceae TaxID=72275 RepID=UPI003D00E6E8
MRQQKAQVKRTCSTFSSICIFVLSLGFLPFSYAQDQRDDLENIKALIEQTKAQLAENLKDSERLQQELKLAELEIAETATLLNKTDRALVQTNKDITALEVEKSVTEKKIGQQQEYLANQLKSAFMAGDYDYAKMLFNQEKASSLERVLTYYQYLNKARKAQIESFRGLIKTFEEVTQQLDKKRNDLNNLKVEQKQQSDQLRNQQQARFAKLRELNQQIETDQARVARLEEQEKSLINAIEQAELAAARARERSTSSVVLSGLNGMQGSLVKPTNGRVEALFGKRRQGQVRWKGIVVRASAGTPVSAVADGKVLYADWLRGFGLVVIVDHGEGYMSVYGRNQAVLKNVGDVVSQGDTISLVGTSGGQDEASLYFEIRHKGKALNPTQWLASL